MAPANTPKVLVMTVCLLSRFPHASGWATFGRTAYPWCIATSSGSVDEQLSQNVKKSGTRRSIRSRFAEICARGWLRDAQRRGWLRIGQLETVDATEPESCEVPRQWGRRCPDVVRVVGKCVSWGKDGDLMRLSGVEAEVVNLHRRVLSRGRHGSIRATITLSGADLDGSAIWRDKLGGLVERLLEQYLRDDVSDLVLSTSIRQRAIGVTGNFSTTRGGAASFRLETTLQPTSRGAVALRNSKLALPARSIVAEALGELYLSTVDLESPFEVTNILYRDDHLVATLVSGERYLSPSVVTEWKEPAALFSRVVDHYAAHNDRAPWFFSFDLPRTTLVLGEGLPWLFNAQNAAPRFVVIAFALLAAGLHLAALPDEIVTLATAPIFTLSHARRKLLPALLKAFLKITALSKSVASALCVSVMPRSTLMPVANLASRARKFFTQLRHLFFAPQPFARQHTRQRRYDVAKWPRRKDSFTTARRLVVVKNSSPPFGYDHHRPAL